MQHTSATSPVPSPRPTFQLSSTDAAAYLGITAGTLNVWRCTKRYLIPYIKVGRLVKYRVADLDSWLASRTITAGGLNED
ncbi:helix-turn-helix protein [Nitrosospira sp. Nsp2]|uniref:helix-turn-helix domain-containing protein n=1 Tax=Nitrosospira sp. Nsp2 TaxID=136548 RepID=UPI000D3255CA|nr:helix-turn-helix domain-containing protein [Nitrosospira sp. Nsp2]PTR14215.1 helix-turn-helix protein [Nitrosospira sp. Nsp2]